MVGVLDKQGWKGQIPYRYLVIERLTITVGGAQPACLVLYASSVMEHA